jgi:phage shock protein A
MANDLIPYTPPQAKAVSLGVKIAIGALITMVGAYVITKTVPTLDAAVNLLTKLFASTINMFITGAVLVVVLLALNETFRPGGSIRKLFEQAYSSFINRITWAMLDVDPISPLLDFKRDVEARLADFNENFAKFDGTIKQLQMQEESFTKDADDQERLAKAAKTQGKDAAFQTASYACGKLRESAANFHSMQQRLVPVRDTIAKLQQAAQVMASNIDVDIRIKRREWDAQKAMGGLDKAARGVLGGSAKQAQANDAMQVISTKYADQMGRLENLAATNQQLLDSIDLNKGAYSQELLDKWNKESGVMLVEAPKIPVLQDQAAVFRNLAQ